jgi:penicillin amidase
VNALGLGRKQAPYVNGYGPSQRHVVDMARVDDEGGFIIPTGQSGIPTSRHYRDQTPLWREGRLWRIPLDRARPRRGPWRGSRCGLAEGPHTGHRADGKNRIG